LLGNDEKEVEESTIAEKFQSLVRLNILTSRMKDIYDILFLASHEVFHILLLHEAFVKTFNRRGTPIRDRKSIFTNEFKSSKEKQMQWTAFLKRSHLESDKTFDKAIDHLEFSFVEGRRKAGGVRMAFHVLGRAQRSSSDSTYEGSA
jgi:hypothetical protein